MRLMDAARAAAGVLLWLCYSIYAQWKVVGHVRRAAIILGEDDQRFVPKLVLLFGERLAHHTYRCDSIAQTNASALGTACFL